MVADKSRPKKRKLMAQEDVHSDDNTTDEPTNALLIEQEDADEDVVVEQDLNLDEILQSGDSEEPADAEYQTADAAGRPPNSDYYHVPLTESFVVLLKQPLYVYGTMLVRLVHGSVEINGYRLKCGEQRAIYAPRNYNEVCLAPENVTNATASTTQQLTAALRPYTTHGQRRLADIVVERLCSDYRPSYAIVELRSNQHATDMIEQLRRHVSGNIFPNMASIKQKGRAERWRCEQLLKCVLNTRPRNSELATPSPSWLHVQQAVERQTKLLVAGGKSVGKSSFLRQTINRNVQRFGRLLFIDLDIGQPEYFVPTTVYCKLVDEPLLAPGWLLNTQPDKAYLVGECDIVQCAAIYMRAVQALLAHCRAEQAYANMPWLVNTMGYNKGFGPELLACICAQLQPTLVAQIQSNRDINNYGFELLPERLAAVPRYIYGAEEYPATYDTFPPWQLHLLPALTASKEATNLSARDIRYLNVIARLSVALHDHHKYLCDCQPISGSLSQLQLVDPRARFAHATPSREELLAAINANLVYLCFKPAAASDTTPLECYGIGVVKSIDGDLINLLPAISRDLSRKPNVEMLATAANCLAKTAISLPNSMLLQQGQHHTKPLKYVFQVRDDPNTKAVRQIYYRPPEFLGRKPRQKKRHNDQKQQ